MRNISNNQHATSTGWQKIFDSRFLQYWLLETKQIHGMMLSLFESFGIDDEKLSEIYEKSGKNSLVFGVTQIGLWPPKWRFKLIQDFKLRGRGQDFP